MAMFKAFSDGVQVNGETVLSIVDGSPLKKLALDILEKNGIKDPQKGRWYPQQKWLDAFKAISEEIGSNLLFSVGYKIPENAKFPSEIDTIQKALGAIDVAYHMNHCNGEIGHYTFELDGEKSGRMICENPYPCDFDKGIITAMARKFRPKDSFGVNVEHEEGPCRKNGDNACVYTISW
jgi:hypothetical protein